ncbi:MAG: glycosyltransferase family 2 protein [Thermoplasmatales archaeon]
MHNPKTEYSCIIADLNGERWLKNPIITLKEGINYYGSDFYELILYDNGSTDNSVSIFLDEVRGDTVYKVIRSEINIGWSPAANAALMEGKGDIIIFLNNDMEMGRESIDSIIRSLKSKENAGIIQFNSISLVDRKTQDSGRAYIDRFGFIYGYEAALQIEEVSFAEFSSFAVRREVFDDVCHFDDSYFMMYEDVDYAWRARLVGWGILFDPNAIVYHYRGGTVGKNFSDYKDFIIYRATKNHITSIIKNLELKNLVVSLPVAVILEILESAYIFVSVGRRKGMLNFKCLVHAILGMGETWNKRKIIQTKRRTNDRFLFKYFHIFDPYMLATYSIIANPKTRGRMAKSNVSPKLHTVKDHNGEYIQVP